MGQRRAASARGTRDASRTTEPAAAGSSGDDKGYDEVEPRADAVLESMRAVGYNLPTAIADLLDNSITAGASEIRVQLNWSGPDSWIRISDNGTGMDEATLVEAMRLGTRNPLEIRSSKDLGRFGLGLKTASFSQCRRLTVRSKTRASSEVTRCWDLDFVRETRTWALLRAARDKTAEKALGTFGSAETGTRVLWQVMDRVVGTADVRDAGAHSNFLKRVDEVSNHLAMVFHRFLSGPKALKIWINDAQVPPWDPFMTEFPATTHLPEERFGNSTGEVVIQPFVLPHQSKVSTDEHAAGGGPRGWIAHQGFYIYRNKRLLVPGDWLGFYKSEEPYRLARIRVDITNALDQAWKIDVKKAQAHPPDADRRRLKQIADATRDQALKAYWYRGKVLERQSARTPLSYVWQQVKRKGKIFYQVNRDYPLIRGILEQKSVSAKEVEAVLNVVEETIPVNFILGTFTDHAQQQPQPFDEASPQLNRVIRAVAASFKAQGLNDEEIRRRLLSTEPFQHYPEIISALQLEDL